MSDATNETEPLAWTDLGEDEQRAHCDVVSAAMGDAELLVCDRVWSAWSYGTMSEHDFDEAHADEGVVEEFAKAMFAHFGAKR